MSKNKTEKRNVIQLSFKNEGADLELYNFLKQKLSAPAYIKEEMWNIYKNGSMQNLIPFKIDPQLEVNTIEESAKEEEIFNDLFQEDADRDEVEF